MLSVSDQIIAQLSSDDPPKSSEELAERLGLSIKNIRPRLATMLKYKHLDRALVPWARPEKKLTPDDILLELADFFRTDTKTKAATGKILWDILSTKGEIHDPITPNNDAELRKALSRQLQAAGRTLAQLAWDDAFPPEAPPEAQNGPGPADSRNHLD